MWCWCMWLCFNSHSKERSPGNSGSDKLINRVKFSSIMVNWEKCTCIFLKLISRCLCFVCSATQKGLTFVKFGVWFKTSANRVCLHSPSQMARVQMYLLCLPLYVVFSCCWDSRLRSLVNKWLTACWRTFLRKTVNTFTAMVPDVPYEQCCLSTSLTSWTDAVLLLYLFILLWCNSPLLLGVLTHGGLVAHQNNFLYLHSGRDIMVQKCLFSLLAFTSWCLELFAFLGP